MAENKTRQKQRKGAMKDNRDKQVGKDPLMIFPGTKLIRPFLQDGSPPVERIRQPHIFEPDDDNFVPDPFHKPARVRKT